MCLDVSTLLKEKGKDLKLELIAGARGIERKITVSDLNRPGLAFCGYFDHFPHERAQIIGNSEHAYLSALDYDNQVKILKKIFSYTDIPCCILTRKLSPLKSLISVLDECKVPLIGTELVSSSLIGDLIYYLDGKLAPTIKMHGVLASVYGLGVFILGKSGIGKSECALELVKRGHMLIADDVVNIKKRSGRILMGSCLDITKHLIEVRGLGIINISEIFGIGSILDKAQIELIVKLEEWTTEVQKIDRLGGEENYADILDIDIPQVSIPVGPGRNLAVLVETAALDRRLKEEGHWTGKELEARVRKTIEEKNEY
ncbi:MAG: HPr(Ser) kinase/phosphatase [Elusimicrobiota bacterium]|jgi:HPr kinase/phosphorylase|nr:HPr(Ser) kinase/phosphatase [Elusimicrobiota bacterium]